MVNPREKVLFVCNCNFLIPGHGTLCIIFNELERDGYIMVGAGGSVRNAFRTENMLDFALIPQDQLVFVFHKPGLAEEKKDGEKKDEVNTNDVKEEEKKDGDKKEKKDKKDKKDKAEKKTDDEKEKTDGASSPSRKEAKHRHSEKKGDKTTQQIALTMILLAIRFDERVMSILGNKLTCPLSRNVSFASFLSPLRSYSLRILNKY